MDEEMEKFFQEGMSRYKQAADVMNEFGKGVEEQLKNILKEQKEWGHFIPKNKAFARSTTYWSVYPLLNAKIDGDFKGEKIKIVIAVNWYLSENNYPFYTVWIEPREQYLEMGEHYDWSSEFEYKGNELRFYPSPDDFNIDRDFKNLLNEFVEFLSE